MINAMTMFSYGIGFTTDHRNKMAGMVSLSSSPVLNPYCKARAKNPKSICSKCYSQQMQRMYKGLKAKLIGNSKALKVIIPVEEWPILNYLFFRFESFGDLFCKNQVINYFNLCKRNPMTNFALWTKNPGFIDMAIKAGYEKPANLQIVLSSPELNKPLTREFVTKKYPFVDIVFTVFTREFCEEHNIVINCGARSCLMCHECYVPGTGLRFINEMLKSDQKKKAH